MTTHAYMLGQHIALARCGLTKTAAIPSEVLQAIKATKDYYAPVKAGLGKNWSLMGGEGGQMTQELMERMQGVVKPEYNQKFLAEADKLLQAGGGTKPTYDKITSTAVTNPGKKVPPKNLGPTNPTIQAPTDTVPDARQYSNPFARMAG